MLDRLEETCQGQADGPAERGLTCARDAEPPPRQPKVLLTLLPGSRGRPQSCWEPRLALRRCRNWGVPGKSGMCRGQDSQQVGPVCQAWPRAGGAGAVDLDLGWARSSRWASWSWGSCRPSPAGGVLGLAVDAGAGSEVRRHGWVQELWVVCRAGGAAVRLKPEVPPWPHPTLCYGWGPFLSQNPTQIPALKGSTAS